MLRLHSSKFNSWGDQNGVHLEDLGICRSQQSLDQQEEACSCRTTIRNSVPPKTVNNEMNWILANRRDLGIVIFLASPLVVILVGTLYEIIRAWRRGDGP